MKNGIKRRLLSFVSLACALFCILSLASCAQNADKTAGGADSAYNEGNAESIVDLSSVPDYSGIPYVKVNGNIPEFTDTQIKRESFEYYSQLDGLGRCGKATACVGLDLMPTEERGSIGQVKPTGWHTVKYDVVDGKYLYNRCHLIGYQLSGENANERNLITGTRYMNVDGMLPFENMVADYVKETENHVMYRVTPVFEGVELVARGVLMEAYSVEDNGEGVCFCVFVYNVQPGVTIDYKTGESRLAGSAPDTGKGDTSEDDTEGDYILNTNTKKFHRVTCPYADSIKYENREEYHGSKAKLEEKGYSPCGNCKP